MEGFGSMLKELRIKRNLNQKQFAELLGISATRLNYWEKDKREPDLFNILKICAVLDITPDELLNIKNQLILSDVERKIILYYRSDEKFKKIINSYLEV